MTKDLALLVGPEQKWLWTEGFLDKVGREPAGGDGEVRAPSLSRLRERAGVRASRA